MTWQVVPVLRGWLAEASEMFALGARRYALSPWNWIDVSMLGLLTASLCLYWLGKRVGARGGQTSYTCDAMVGRWPQAVQVAPRVRLPDAVQPGDG